MNEINQDVRKKEQLQGRNWGVNVNKLQKPTCFFLFAC